MIICRAIAHRPFRARPRLFAILLIIVAAPVFLIRAAGFGSLEIIGDSIAAGANPESSAPYGWAHMLEGIPPPADVPCTVPLQTIHTLWPGIKVHNAAIPGASSHAWANPDGPAFRGLAGRNPALVIIMLGGNDFQGALDDGQFDAEELRGYRERLRWIIQQAKSLPSSPEVLLVSYYDCFDGMSANLPIPLYRGYSLYAKRANDATSVMARQENCRVVNVFDAFHGHGYGRDLGGGAMANPPYFRMPVTKYDIHPVTAGHWRIYQEVMRALEELKARPPE